MAFLGFLGGVPRRYDGSVAVLFRQLNLSTTTRLARPVGKHSTIKASVEGFDDHIFSSNLYIIPLCSLNSSMAMGIEPTTSTF